MGRYTTTISEICQAELINNGFNEFKNNGYLTFFDEYYNFINFYHNNNEEMVKVVEQSIFKNFNFIDTEKTGINEWFKMSFLTRFWSYEINFQTVDLFRQRLYSYLRVNEKGIKIAYSDFEKFIKGSTENSSSGNGANERRNIFSTQPQDEINMDLDNPILKYADNNTIGRENTNTSNASNTNNYNLGNLENGLFILENIFTILEKKLFLGVY